MILEKLSKNISKLENKIKHLEDQNSILVSSLNENEKILELLISDNLSIKNSLNKILGKEESYLKSSDYKVLKNDDRSIVIHINNNVFKISDFSVLKSEYDILENIDKVRDSSDTFLAFPSRNQKLVKLSKEDLKTISDKRRSRDVDSFIEQENVYALVLDYVEGIPLNEFVEKRRNFDKLKNNICDFLESILLMYEDNGIFSSDLSMDNIIVTPDYGMVVIDLSDILTDDIPVTYTDLTVKIAKELSMYFCDERKFDRLEQAYYDSDDKSEILNQILNLFKLNEN